MGITTLRHRSKAKAIREVLSERFGGAPSVSSLTLLHSAGYSAWEPRAIAAAKIVASQ